MQAVSKLKTIPYSAKYTFYSSQCLLYKEDFRASEIIIWRKAEGNQTEVQLPSPPITLDNRNRNISLQHGDDAPSAAAASDTMHPQTQSALELPSLPAAVLLRT